MSDSQYDPDPALEEFCRAGWPDLVGFFALHGTGLSVAEELAQETLARVCQHWRQVQRTDSPQAWMYRVAWNLLRSHFRWLGVRRQARSRPRPFVVDPIEAVAGTFDLRIAISKLPDRQRTVLSLRYFADLSVKEVSVVLGCPEGTVKTLTHAGIATLRETLSSDDEGKNERTG